MDESPPQRGYALHPGGESVSLKTHLRVAAAAAVLTALPVPIADKVAHVRRAPQVRRHHCHWPGCEKQVPPAKWGCKEHWFKLPGDLRRAIWRAYRPGQEIDQRPSAEYVEVARRVQAWILAHHPPPPETGRLL